MDNKKNWLRARPIHRTALHLTFRKGAFLTVK